MLGAPTRRASELLQRLQAVGDGAAAVAGGLAMEVHTGIRPGEGGMVDPLG